jgi:hypothetical protein
MYFAPSDDYGDFTFSGSLTNYSFGDFLLGLPNPSYFAVIGPQMDARSVHWGVYGQDTWQVNSHLTVNYGLRWELLPPFVESNGDIATYLTTGNNLTVVVPDKFYPFIANNPLLQQINTRVSSRIQRMFASGPDPVAAVFEHRDGEPGGASSRPSGLELA